MTSARSRRFGISASGVTPSSLASTTRATTTPLAPTFAGLNAELVTETSSGPISRALGRPSVTVADRFGSVGFPRPARPSIGSFASLRASSWRALSAARRRAAIQDVSGTILEKPNTAPRIRSLVPRPRFTSRRRILWWVIARVSQDPLRMYCPWSIPVHPRSGDDFPMSSRPDEQGLCSRADVRARRTGPCS